ncbi:MAG: type II toxin-antitoxin system HicB family antitoxin [Candidatus Gastranaerophilales bacterium]|nr:type II toxin-antitoxin system HicB family antitoxin [Candidatus Gastranaerophilales bacterium]
MNKDLNYYMNLPWEFELEKAPEGGFYARVKGLSCYSHGDDMIEAVKNINEALETYIEGCLEENITIPEPVSEEDCNGRLSIRVKKSLHCKLAKIAREEDVSISHLINDALIKVYDKVS